MTMGLSNMLETCRGKDCSVLSLKSATNGSSDFDFLLTAALLDNCFDWIDASQVTDDVVNESFFDFMFKRGS